MGKYMFQYVRNIETKGVIGFNAVHKPAEDGFEDVIVIPLAQWQRLVEIVACYDPEADEIIASIEVPHD